MNDSVLNMDACVAVADLVARTGGKQLEIGYQDQTVSSKDARWYASAYFKGMRLFCDEQESPQAAADGLALKLLIGGKCTACHRTVRVAGTNYPPRRYDCAWFRAGDAWVQGCTGKRRATRD